MSQSPIYTTLNKHVEINRCIIVEKRSITIILYEAKATFIQALCQVLPHRPVIVLDLAWVITTANVIRKC